MLYDTNRFPPVFGSFNSEMLLVKPRSSHQKCWCPRPVTLLKKRLWHSCFSWELCEICMNTFFTEHLWTTASESLRIGPILKNLWFAFIKVTRNKFYYHISFLRDFFCNSSFNVKTIKFNRFHNRKTFLFHVSFKLVWLKCEIKNISPH